jgi:hypothetical protein
MPYPTVANIDNPAFLVGFCRQFQQDVGWTPGEDDDVFWLNLGKRRLWHIAENIRNMAKHLNTLLLQGFTFSVYYEGGNFSDDGPRFPIGRKPVGLMIWRDSGSEGVVDRLAMLPGRETEAVILIEHAVSLSQKANHQGRTFFRQLDPFEMEFELPWFEYLQSATVVPRESSAWVEFEGEWRLKENLFKNVNWRRATVWREIGR